MFTYKIDIKVDVPESNETTITIPYMNSDQIKLFQKIMPENFAKQKDYFGEQEILFDRNNLIMMLSKYEQEDEIEIYDSKLLEVSITFCILSGTKKIIEILCYSKLLHFKCINTNKECYISKNKLPKGINLAQFINNFDEEKFNLCQNEDDFIKILKDFNAWEDKSHIYLYLILSFLLFLLLLICLN